MKLYLKWGLLLALPCYLLDQISKWWILANLRIGDMIVMLPGYFEILHVRNTGAAFGILRNLPVTYRTIFFVSITVIACAAIIVIFKQMQDESAWLKAFLCLILAGALGNLTDRIIHREVVDFINVHAGSFYWPTFNIADTFITGGMIGLIIYTFWGAKKLSPPDANAS